MSFPGSGRGRGPDSGNNHVFMSAGRGAVLVAVAVIVGLLVLKVVDDSKSTASPSPAGTEAPTSPTGAVPATNPDGTPAQTTATTAGTTNTTKPNKTTSTTAKGAKSARPNDQVVVQVLNGSGIQNAATTRTNDLKARGYQTAPAGNAPAQRTGNAVQCKAGYEKEAE